MRAKQWVAQALTAGRAYIFNQTALFIFRVILFFVFFFAVRFVSLAGLFRFLACLFDADDLQRKALPVAGVFHARFEEKYASLGADLEIRPG